MFLERLLQITMATLAALSTVLLDMGQRDRVLAPLVVLAALASVWITDIKGWFRLNRLVANLGGLIAVLLALRETLRYEGETRILTIGSLLVFLQVILLFQEKDERVYWQMIMLSLLQVVVATLFNQGVWFGFLLVLHTLVALSALLLLFMYRQWRSHRPAAELPPPEVSDAGRRWPLATLQSGFTSAPAGSGRSGLGRELLRRLAWMVLGTLAMTLLVFFTVPRLGESAWRGAIVRQRHMVGFDDRVKLGTLGSLVEDPEEVLRVQLLDEESGRTFKLDNESGIYLRGAVLTHYERGGWACPEYPPGRRQVLPPLWEQDDAPPVRQVLEIEPADRPELFCVWPFVALGPNENLLLDFTKQRLVRTHESCRRRMHFELGTHAIVDRQQAALNSWREPGVGMTFQEWRTEVVKEQLLQMPELPRLAALAERWDRESGLPATDRKGRAKFLERRLRDSGLYKYSLEGCRRNPELDPVEDFVSEHQQGHCEYFATALAMMLRSRDIPSRVVIGYRCDEWNSLGRYYQVRQLHAHAWVEAYLEPEHVPREVLAAQRLDSWSEGAWLRLDATAAGGDAVASSGTSFLSQGAQWLQSLWDSYVLDMDRQRQRDAVYQPLLDAVENTYKAATDPDSWRGLGESLGSIFGFLPSAGTLGWWIWTVFLTLVGLAAVLLAGWGVRRMGRRLWPRLAGKDATTAAVRKVEVEFYYRLEMLLARHGLVRAAGQTQREFAAAAGLRIAAIAREPRLAPLAGQVADAFYRVRFGGLPLDNPQAETVEQALTELSHVGELASPPSGCHG